MLDIIELDWKEFSMNGNKVHLQKWVIIPLRDKFKIRCIVRRGSLLLHIMLSEGKTWFSLKNG